MARGHAHENCRYGDDGFAFAPRPERAFSPGQNEDLDQAFKNLAAALEALPDPVTACVQKLTPTHIKAALEAGSVTNRNGVLRPLGLNLAPRTIGTAMSADVRNRLRRAAQCDRRHAADRLGAPLYADMMVSALAPDEVARDAAEKVAARAPELARLALWAGTLPSAAGARILLWAADQPWFAPEVSSAAEVTAVLSAAQAVVDATADFDMFSAMRPGDPAPDADALYDEHAADTATGDDAAPTEQDLTITDNAVLDQSDPAPVPTSPEDTSAVQSSPAQPAETAPPPGNELTAESLGALLTALEGSLTTAAAEARDMARIMDAGRPPSPRSLTMLEETLREFAACEAHLRAVGSVPADPSTTDLRTALEAANQEQDEALIRSELELFCSLTAPQDPPLSAALSAATTRVQALLSSMLWSEQDRAEAEAVALLTQMATGKIEATEVLATQNSIVTAAPQLAFLAIRAGSLTASPTAAPGLDTAPDVAEGPDTHQPAPVDQPLAEAVGEATEVCDDDDEADDAVTPPTASARDLEAATQRTAANQTSADEVAQTPPPAPNGTAVDLPGAAATQALSDEQPVTDRDDTDASLCQSITALVGQGRHALAASLSAHCDTPPLDPALLRTSALAAAVRTPHGQVASTLHQHIADLDSDTIAGDTSALLLTAPALLRTALVTGEPAAGAVLLALQPHLGERLGTLAGEVGRRAVTGVLVESPPLTALADVTETERVLAEAQDAASELLRPRRMRVKRASDIVGLWMAEDGLIGAALHAVVADDRSKLDLVLGTIATLNDTAEVARSVDTLDRQLRTTSSKALQGSARTDLFPEAVKAVPALTQWADAVGSLSRADRSARWSTTEVTDMRAAVLEAGPAALEALDDKRTDDDPLVVAVGASAYASLAHTLALLDGTASLSSADVSPATVLGTDALRVRGARVDVVTGEVSLPEELSAADAAAAVDRTWDEAVRAHVEDENFIAAHHLIRAARSGQLDGDTDAISDEATALVSSHEASSRTELDWRRAELASELRDARRNGQIVEEQDSELTAMLRDTERPDADLATVRDMLTQISRRLPDYRSRAADGLRKRLAQVSATNQKVKPEDVDRVSGFIDAGDLGTAEELTYLLETNEDVPSVRDHDDLDLFFPEVPDAVPDGITAAIIATARNSGKVESCPTLDFTSLNSDQAALTADALAGWRTLGATPPEKRYNMSEHELLLPALRVAGLEAKKTVHLNDVPRARDRRYIDVYDVTVTGKAMVPEFGSAAGDRRRILLAWGRPSADTLMSWVDQDPAGEAVIVAYFGTMSSQVRHDLATRSPRSQAPVIVLDDAALVYLAARGDRLLEATMRILLPFAHVNPYIRQKRGLVAPEMFYGRKDEQRQVVDPNGTQILYGGRGLGKSALLRDAESAFERSSPAPGTRIALYLSLDDLQIGGKSMGAEALWDGLHSELTRRGVIAAKGASRAGNAHAKVITGINAWLEEDSARRLLILLDESDRFFESDAPTFGETSRLRNLGTTTNNRAKVVFAGLHSVQRFAKVAGNGPFSHLAQRPRVIGPLKPQSALNLLTEPMAAMGYVFEEPDLVNRVLANCSYQPFLLQMFGHRLVEHMHERRGELGAHLPYVVTRADIDTVETNEELREDISTAFRETLNLDPRYNVIANVMARNAHESGLEARLSDIELREECLHWWEEGFTSLDMAAFRSYLNEMVGLGVLARNSDGRGWRLRGPAVLNMVGMPSDVDNQLLGAETESLREEFVALSTRNMLPDGRYSPLTAGQVDDLLGDHSIQVRVVLGSMATGVADTETAIRDAAKTRFTVPPVNSRNAFETALVGGEPGERRVVISDLTGHDPEVCAATLRSAIELTPDRPGVTRSVVLVTGAHQMPFWRAVMATQTDTLSLGTVALARHNLKTLRVWTMTAERFRGVDRTERLLEVTGGWPFLIERVVAKAPQSSKEPGAMAALEKHLATPAGAVELIDAVGLKRDPLVSRAYGDLVTMLGADSTDLAGLHLGASESTSEEEAAVACLMALGVFTPLDKGQYQLEPVLAGAWSLTR